MRSNNGITFMAGKATATVTLTQYTGVFGTLSATDGPRGVRVKAG